MSITLITAVPGGGKTSFVVWHIIRKAVEEKRIVYCNAIPKLKLEVLPVSRDDVRTWAEREAVDPNDPEGIYRLHNFSEGSLIVCDEIQYLWPAKGYKEPTEDIKYLTQHRKHGLDFVLITQSPHLVHSHVLQVVDKHIHIVPTWSGRKMYEWPEYCANPKHRTNQQNAVKTNYTIPKESFDLYYSATKHTKVERRIPKMLWASIIVLCLIPILGYSAYSRVMEKVEGNAQEEQETTIEQPQQQDNPVTHAVDTPDPVPQAITPLLPTILSKEYDWKNISACLDSPKYGCACYGKSSERLIVPKETCQLATKHGWTQL